MSWRWWLAAVAVIVLGLGAVPWANHDPPRGQGGAVDCVLAWHGESPQAQAATTQGRYIDACLRRQR